MKPNAYFIRESGALPVGAEVCTAVDACHVKVEAKGALIAFFNSIERSFS